MNELAIKVDNLSMKFNLPKEKITSLKEYTIKFLKGTLHYSEFVALSNVSFEIAQGESLAIIGDNGSGKSTLLKIISGIYPPTSGNISISGSISPMIELGAGFDVELTARENIFLNGALLGHTTKLVKENFEKIVDFAELWEFIDVSIKNFSSGMIARLAFSIATFTRPDILICDEILGVGDFKFQEKCSQRITELLQGGTTFILVSHSIETIIKMTQKTLYLEKGNQMMFGNTKEVCDYYVKRTNEKK